METTNTSEVDDCQVDPVRQPAERLPNFVVRYHWKRLLALFILISIVCFVAVPRYINRDYDNGKRTDTEVNRIKAASAIIGIFLVVILLHKPLRRRPAIIVDDSGFVLNTGSLTGP